ncbi:glycosyltransferase [Nocardioides aurantiacus]|uniref:Glycosyl transferase family 2 n=1 Tax=Nocardioides aurantiacus TaxID=86796 RepID=A0A3N2CRY6_9ACTN|nr:glycosyltransferase [Nocardioides aurantiacus]ROR90128.1 glycosyl transferase family 2 [Nocardioides aurantiacus]
MRSADRTWPVLAPEPEVQPEPLRIAPSMSVVVAAYQAERTLAAALDSALAQTLPPLEVVVCDDGSTDDTAAVLERYAGRVLVVRQDNGGEAAAKNAAVEAASGDFVVVLDADDVFEAERLEALTWLAVRRPDLDVLTTDAVVEADGREVRRAYHPGWTFPVEDQRAEILSRNFVLGLAAVRRERWLEVGGFDRSLSRATDWDFWLRLVLGGSRVGLVDAPLARYQLATGTLSSDRIGVVRARVVVLERADARDDLAPHERAVVGAALRRERLDLTVRSAVASLSGSPAAARRAHLRLAVHPGLSPGGRVRAVVGVVAPARLAARRRRRGDGRVEIGSGLWVQPLD